MSGEEMTDSDRVKAAELESIQKIADTNPEEAAGRLRGILDQRKQNMDIDEHEEGALLLLCKVYASLKDTQALMGLLKEFRPDFHLFEKAKREAIIKTVFDQLALIPGTEDEQIALCEEYIEYFKAEKRTFLRQRFETKLAHLFSTKREHQKALTLLSKLESEVKKLDDKLLLVEIFLIESRTHFALNNKAKAKSSLTAARSNANAVYVGVYLQAEIDMQSGIVNSSEKDFRTAFSYFLEAHEGFESKHSSLNSKKALTYMLLSKIMNGQGGDVPGILNAKNSLQYANDETIKALKQIASAYKARSLSQFSKILEEFSEVIGRDELLSSHLSDLEGELMEQNLQKIIEPYSRVDIDRIAELINLDEDVVLDKLSKMILDKKFRGILDQGSGELIVFDEPVEETVYQDSLKVISSMGDVIDNLVSRARKLQAQ